jgi:putative tricarboxylic transport membrane protein
MTAETPETRETSEEPVRRAWGEFVAVVLVGVLGIAVLVGASRITVPGTSNTIGPRFFPYVLGVLLLVVAVLLLIQIARGDRAPMEESEDVDPDARTDWRPVVVIAVAFAAHALLINVVGWPLAVTAMFLVVAKALGAPGWIRPALVGGIGSVAVWLVFVKALGVSLPGGILLELVARV